MVLATAKSIYYTLYLKRLLKKMSKIYSCPECKKTFNRKSSKDKHFLFRHGESVQRKYVVPVRHTLKCPFCQSEEKVFLNKKDLITHIDSFHLNELKYSLHKSAINGKVQIFRKHIFGKQSLQDFTSDKENQKEIADVVKHEISKTPTVKVALIISAVYQIPDLTKSTEKTNSVSDNQS